MNNEEKGAMKGASQIQLHNNTKELIVQELIRQANLNKYFGDDKRVTRWQLHVRLRVDEREIRDAVQHLREDGEPICITKDGLGYWYGTDEEYESTVIADYLSRMGSMGRIVKAHYDRKQIKGQMEFELDEEYGGGVMFGVDFSEPIRLLEEAIEGLHKGGDKL